MWFEHMKRMEEERQVRGVWEGKSVGKNRTERPRVTWNSTVEKTVREKGQTWNATKEMTGDRTKWSQFVKQSKAEKLTPYGSKRIGCSAIE